MRQLSADALAIGKLALLDSRKQQVLDNAVRLNYPVHVTFVLANYRAAELLEGIELATVQALVADLTKDAPRFHEARVDTVEHGGELFLEPLCTCSVRPDSKVP